MNRSTNERQRAVRRRASAAWALAALLALGTTTTTRRAWAQTPEARAAAEALFDEGLKKLDGGKFADACKAFEASHKLDPGIGVLLYLGECYEKAGRPASAWAAFREAASLAKQAKQGEREAVATRRAAALEGKFPRVAVQVAAGAAAAKGITVTRDGAVIAREAWGVELPTDPGEHTFEATAEGKQPFRTRIEVPAGGPPLQVHIGDLADAPSAAPDPASIGANGLAPTAEPSAAPPAASWRGTALLTSGVVGALGLGAGAVLAVSARSRYKGSLADCAPDDPNRCSSAGVARRDDARSLGTFATLAFGVGGAALAAGVAVFVLVPSSSGMARLEVGPLPGGAALRGVF